MSILPVSRQQSSSGRARPQGFTLLEILVAVAVVAIALTAVMTEVSRDLHNTTLLRDKTLAQWVAMNTVNEWQLKKDWPGPGQHRGETEMAGQNWYWTVKVSTTDDPNVRRLDVEVSERRDAKQPRAALLAYLGRPSK